MSASPSSQHLDRPANVRLLPVAVGNWPFLFVVTLVALEAGKATFFPQHLCLIYLCKSLPPCGCVLIRHLKHPYAVCMRKANLSHARVLVYAVYNTKQECNAANCDSRSLLHAASSSVNAKGCCLALISQLV